VSRRIPVFSADQDLKLLPGMTCRLTVSLVCLRVAGLEPRTRHPGRAINLLALSTPIVFWPLHRLYQHGGGPKLTTGHPSHQAQD